MPRMRWSVRRASGICLVAALVLGILQTPGAAFHGDDLPLLAAGGGEGSGWVSFTVHGDGDVLAADVWLEEPAGAFQLGYKDFNPNDSLLSGFRLTFVPGRTAVQTRIGGETAHVALPWDGPERPGMAVTWNLDDRPSPFKMLLHANGAAARWGYEIRGGSGVTLGGIETGDGTFIHVLEDFEHEDHAAVSVNPAVPAALRATTGGELEVSFERALIVSFQPFSSDPHVYDLTARRGSVSLACPCNQQQVLASRSWPPGTYVFRVEGAGAGQTGEVVLAGIVDPRLPP